MKSHEKVNIKMCLTIIQTLVSKYPTNCHLLNLFKYIKKLSVGKVLCFFYMIMNSYEKDTLEHV